MATLLDIVKKDATDRSVTLCIIDDTDGTKETGVVFNTSGIDLWYRREGAVKVSITEADLATPALDDPHLDGGFLHIGDGEYRLDPPDAAFATGANYVDFGGTVTGMIVIGGRVRLVDVDLEDTVRAGLTALPNAAADAAGGLPISDAGGLDLDSRLDAAVSTRATAAALTTAQNDLDTLTGSDGATLATAQGNYAPAKAGDAMALTSAERTTLTAAVWNALTSGMSTAGSIGKKLADWTIHSASDVWAAGTRTLTAATNITSTGGTTVPQTGDSFARLGAPAGASVSADVAAVKAETALIVADTNELQTDWANGGRLDLILDTAAAGSASAGDIAAAVLAAAIDGAIDLETAVKYILAYCTGDIAKSGDAYTYDDAGGTPLYTLTSTDDDRTFDTP